jgi:transposase, IS5 family
MRQRACAASLVLSCTLLPNETTILNFRRFIEDNNLSAHLGQSQPAPEPQRIAAQDQHHHRYHHSIAEPCSTKNESGERDPEMHQTKKAAQRYFGMKAHIDVDKSGSVAHLES